MCFELCDSHDSECMKLEGIWHLFVKMSRCKCNAIDSNIYIDFGHVFLFSVLHRWFHDMNVCYHMRPC